MAYLYFTVVAIVLYFLSDWILNKIEEYMGKRLKSRSVVFFVIITVLAMGSFNYIDTLMTPPPESTQNEISTPDQVMPAPIQQ